MQKKIRFLFILSCIAVIGIITIQSIWISKYYTINLQRFEREINIAFDKAVKKEFSIRNDSLEALLYRFVMDTNNVKMYSKWNKYGNAYVYSFESQNDNTPNGTGFSSDIFNRPITSQTDTNKRIVARLYAQRYRKRDLDNNAIYYDRQNIGKFMSRSMREYEFDSGNLKKIYKQFLAEQDIYDAFYLNLAKDKAGPESNPDSVKRKEEFVTKAIPTYEISYQYSSIRAVFPSANNFLFRQLILIVAGSLILLIIVGFALFYMVRLLQKEKKASAIKNDFINNITHELKTPIATISTAIEAFEHFDALDDPQKTKRYLQTSRQQVDRLSDLVTKILNISIYERQDFEIKKETIDLDKLINDLIKNYSILYNHDVKISYVNPAPGMTLKGDKTSLYSAISNLVDNAIKYSDKKPSITIHVFKEENNCILEVQDNGIGISKEDSQKIFDKFYRVPSNNHHIKGYGLGLFYVKSIIEKHNGWYSVKSKPGEGSVFKISLPYE